MWEPLKFQIKDHQDSLAWPSKAAARLMFYMCYRPHLQFFSIPLDGELVLDRGIVPWDKGHRK